MAGPGCGCYTEAAAVQLYILGIILQTPLSAGVLVKPAADHSSRRCVGFFFVFFLRRTSMKGVKSRECRWLETAGGGGV